MKFVHEFIFHLVLLFLPNNFASIVDNDVEGRIEIHMPRAKPEQAETYLCTPFKLDKSRTHYITGFEPRANKNTAHHMLLFGCKTPGKRDPLYNCGSMAAKQKGLSSSINPCGLGTAIIYAWAQNAPKLHLPKDVAFRVSGPDSGIDWLVLQVWKSNNF
jgi:peptidylglycine monooxygenase